MAMIRPDRLQKEYDVIVVGSGAAGGQTAYTLTMDCEIQIPLIRISRIRSFSQPVIR
jgi:choline dehydrogenase-like flavoprotein